MVTRVSPPVSVVVPTYQNAPFVAATLDSILAQTYTDFELVVADHSSCDDTWEIVLNYADIDDRIRVQRTEPGGGAERNWNRVTESARGRLLKLVCGDDILYPRCLERQVAAMEDNPGVAFVACRRDVVDAHGERLIADRGLDGMAGRVDGSDAVRRSVRAGTNVFGEPVCTLLRREDVVSVGGWSGREGYFIDHDLYVRVLRIGDLYAVPETLAAFRVSTAQWSARLIHEQAQQSRRFLRRVAAESDGAVAAGDVRRGVARAYAKAWGRRLAYSWWGSRLEVPPGPRTRSAAGAGPSNRPGPGTSPGSSTES